MSKLKRFISTSAIYFVGNIMSKMVAFILLPLYTKYIIPEQYGEYDLVLTLINLIAPIAFFQIWDGMFRFSFDSEEDNDKYKVINNAIFVFTLGIALYFIFFFCIYNFYKFQYSWSAITYGFLFAVQYIVSFAARIFLKNALFVFSGLLNTLIAAVTNVVLIVIFDWDVESLYVAASCGCCVQILLIEINLHLFSNFKVKDLDKQVCLQMLRFSIPLCIATISYWLLSGFTKISVTNSLGVSDNGQYAVANRFASMITVFVNVFQFAWNEIAYLMANDKNRTEKYTESIILLFKTVIMGSAIVCILIKFVFPYFIDGQYSKSFYLIPISILGVAFNAIAGFLGTFFMTEKKTNYILYTTLIVALLNCIICALFIDKIGLLGVVSVLTGAFALLMVMRLILLKTKFGVDVHVKSFFYIFFFLIALIVYYSHLSAIIDVVFIIATMITYIYSIRKYLLLIKTH